MTLFKAQINEMVTDLSHSPDRCCRSSKFLSDDNGKFTVLDETSALFNGVSEERVCRNCGNIQVTVTIKASKIMPIRTVPFSFVDSGIFYSGAEAPDALRHEYRKTDLRMIYSRQKTSGASSVNAFQGVERALVMVVADYPITTGYTDAGGGRVQELVCSVYVWKYATDKEIGEAFFHLANAPKENTMSPGSMPGPFIPTSGIAFR